MGLYLTLFNMGKPFLRLLFPRLCAYADAKKIVHSDESRAHSREQMCTLLQLDPTLLCPDSRGSLLFEMAAAGRLDMLEDVLSRARYAKSRHDALLVPRISCSMAKPVWSGVFVSVPDVAIEHVLSLLVAPPRYRRRGIS